MSATAILTLTLQFLTADTDIDKHGRASQKERITYTTPSIPYATMTACNNAKEEYNLAVGAYQLFKRPTRIIGAICNDSNTGVVE